MRAIGVANFLPEYLESLLEQAEVLPAVNQIEVHPYFTQTQSRELHSRHGILTQAWSPMVASRPIDRLYRRARSRIRPSSASRRLTVSQLRR